MREPSDHPSNDGGWYHPYSNSVRVFRPPKKDVAPPLKNAQSLLDSYRAKTSGLQLHNFAQHLGVSPESLEWLDAAWSEYHKAWAFPMRDGESRITGIRLRWENGEKRAVSGSRQGLFIPTYFEGDSELHDMCFVTEGPTDCAAVLTLGFYSMGRPSCNCSPDQLKLALKLHQIRRVVIVADNDDKRRLNGQQWSPGIDGAKQLGAALKIPHVIWLPPTKDVRDYVREGGTKQMILSDLKMMIWKR